MAYTYQPMALLKKAKPKAKTWAIAALPKKKSWAAKVKVRVKPMPICCLWVVTWQKLPHRNEANYGYIQQKDDG